MRTRTYEQMLEEYGITELEPDDKSNREEMLAQYKYSVIVEGEHMEHESLDLWIAGNIRKDEIKWLYYGNINYNFGFAEYFFEKETDALSVAEVVSFIYTTYPHSYPPNHILRSDGAAIRDYDPSDRNAIIFNPRKE